MSLSCCVNHLSISPVLQCKVHSMSVKTWNVQNIFSMVKSQSVCRGGFLNMAKCIFSFHKPMNNLVFISCWLLVFRRKVIWKKWRVQEYCHLADLDSPRYLVINFPANIRNQLAACLFMLPCSIFAGAEQTQIQCYYMVCSDNTICNEWKNLLPRR